MANLKEKVVIAVSSRALFDLEEEHALFEEKGYKAFRDHQVRYQNTPLRPGVAFPFVRRLLALNELYGDLAPFRVLALSRNSPETAQRFFHSCRHYRLPISAGGFTSSFLHAPNVPRVKQTTNNINTNFFIFYSPLFYRYFKCLSR